MCDMSYNIKMKLLYSIVDIYWISKINNALRKANIHTVRIKLMIYLSPILP